MQSDTIGAGFSIWAADNQVYGPVELPTLVAWVKDERVTAATWVFSEKDDAWSKAATVPELAMFFRPKSAAGAGAMAATALKPAVLRRVKIFAGFRDDQLEQFIPFIEVQHVRQWAEIVRQGEHGDALFLVLEGELRVRLAVGGRESILATLGPGEFFGEISLFDQGPRSADVIANRDSVLLKVSAAAFERLLREAPALAAPFLAAAARTMTARIRADNKRHSDSLQLTRSVGL
jgi:hypothetical protein